MRVFRAHRSCGQVDGRHRLASLWAFAAGCILIWPAAHAQSPPVADASANTTDTGLEEVTVTAQRREQSLQQVPISVRALDSDVLEDQGVLDTQSLAAAVPGLVFNKVATGSAIFLRGIGTNNGQIGAEPTVAMYVDGVYVPSVTGTQFDFNNVERVEVAKGPQGTLFGRNTTGGVVQVITRTPSTEPRAEFNLGYGNFDTAQGSFYGTMGLGDTLAADLAVGGRDQNEGWGRNITRNESAFTASNVDARTKWLWTPSEQTKAQFALYFSRMITEQGVSLHILPGALGLNGQPSGAGFYDTEGNLGDFIENKNQRAMLRIDHDADWGTFVSTTSVQKYRNDLLFDQDSTPTNFVRIINVQKEAAQTQEFQLQSPTDGRFEWMAGLFFFNDKSELQPLGQSGLLSGASVSTTLNSELKTRSYAGYGELRFKLPAAFDLTLGARYTRDEKEIEGVRTAQVGGVFGTAAQEVDEGEPTYRVSLSRQFAPAIMGYASFNRGFKSGGWDLTGPEFAPVQPEFLDAYEVGVKTEWLNRRLRVNASTFYYDYSNIQLIQVVAGGFQLLNAASAEIKGLDIDFGALLTSNLSIQGGLSYLDSEYTDFPNAPRQVPRPTGGNSTVTFDASGESMIRAPKLSASATLTYTQATDMGRFGGSIGYAYSDSYFWDFAHRIRQPSTNLVSAALRWNSSNDAWGVEFWGRNLLDEEYYSYASASGLGDIGSPASPLTYGFTVSRRFD